MSEIVQGEKPTDEEMKEINVIARRIAVRACAKRREEKWLALSAKETLTPDEKEWFDNKKNRANSSRRV